MTPTHVIFTSRGGCAALVLVSSLCAGACGGPPGADEALEGARATSGGERARRARTAATEGERDDGAPAREAEQATYALVQDDAWLYTAPEDTATRVRVVNRSRGAANAFSMRVVGAQAGWVALEPLDARDEARHCVPTLRGIRALRVRLWIRETALAGVTPRRVRLAFDDGTGAELRPGTRVEPLDALSDGDRSIFTVYARGVAVNLPLGPEAVSTRYTLDEPSAEPGNEDEMPLELRVRAMAPRSIAAETPLELGAGARLAREALFERDATAPWAAFIAGRARRGELRPAHVRAQCGVFTVRVEPSALAPAPAPEAPRTDATVAPAAATTGLRARPGAFVFWPDGSRAGRVREAVRFDARDGEGDRGYPCVRLGLVTGYVAERDRRGAHALRVCLAPADLEGT